MRWIQRLMTSIVPRSWRDSMVAESRKWHVQCPCDHEQSVWDRGGIRWKAAGEPRVFGKCAACGQNTWHRVYFKHETPQTTTTETP